MSIGKVCCSKEDRDNHTYSKLSQFTLDPKYTKSPHGKGKVDPVFEELKKDDFPILEDPLRRGRTCSWDIVFQGIHGALFPPPLHISQRCNNFSSPHIFHTQIPSLYNNLTLHKVEAPTIITFWPILVILPASMVVP